MRVVKDVDELIRRIDRRRGGGDRVLIGIVGEPGSGKSTVSAALADRLGGAAVVVPMDGFHLANRELSRLGRAARKGAIDTFDADGYVHLLRRLRNQQEAVVYAPDYVRGMEESVAGSIPVAAEISVVITEGNYLLDADKPWCEVRSILDEVWFVEAPPEVRIERIVRRHIRFGMDERAATAWAMGPDQVNADRVRAMRADADLIIDVMGFAETLG
ncbi:nucleoside/nucleotide kinase family protein [Nocardia sp. 348MFTsu5.1]|uniref:nucleoside/nucleotide kinase family protein n=1 Tax=Nocardia sp. 348MFTsu5.1 TaxID=1172185 RepID=UPI000379E3D7